MNKFALREYSLVAKFDNFFTVQKIALCENPVYYTTGYGVLKTASLEKLKARFSVKLWIIKNR